MRLASAVSSRPRAFALWWQLARRSFHRMSTYRAATFAGVFTNSVFGFLRAYVLLAVLEVRPGLAGYDARDVVTYTFLTQGLLATVFGFNESEIPTRIRSGDIVSDLYRPVDFQGYWLANDIGRAAFQVIFRGIPPVLVGALAFGIKLPGDLMTWVVFVASVGLAVVIGFGVRFLGALTGFWLLDTRGVQQIMVITAMFFAGLTVPLGFLPGDLADVARWLPFAGMSQLPVDIYLGEHRAIADAAAVLARQAVWATLLIGLGRVVASRAFRKTVVQGG